MHYKYYNTPALIKVALQRNRLISSRTYHPHINNQYVTELEFQLCMISKPEVFQKHAWGSSYVH